MTAGVHRANWCLLVPLGPLLTIRTKLALTILSCRIFMEFVKQSFLSATRVYVDHSDISKLCCYRTTRAGALENFQRATAVLSVQFRQTFLSKSN